MLESFRKRLRLPDAARGLACWTNLNAICSWRGCDKAQAFSLWNRKINNPPASLGSTEDILWAGPPNSQQIPPLIEPLEEPHDTAVGSNTKPCVEEWKCVSLFIFLNVVAAVWGEDLWLRQVRFNRMESDWADRGTGGWGGTVHSWLDAVPSLAETFTKLTDLLPFVLLAAKTYLITTLCCF